MSNIKAKTPKILMVIDAWFPHLGGGQTHAWELAKQLVKQGFLVTIVTRNLGSWNEKYPGIEVIRLGTVKPFANFWARLEFLLKALIYCLKQDFDLFHAQAFSPGLLVPLIKVLKNKPTIFTVHGRGDKVAGINIGMAGLEEVVVYGIAYDLEITVAKNTLNKATKAKKTVVIPNGVTINQFKTAIRDRKNINNLLFVGRLSYEKGADLLIEAFKKLNKTLHLTVVGDGEKMNHLKQQAKGLAVTFKGKLTGDALQDEFKKADLLIMPSRTEGQPITLFESWASKLPIIVTNVGDNARYVKDLETGFICQPELPDLVDTIEKALQCSTLLEIADNAYKKVQLFTWEKVGEQTAKEFKELLNGTS